MRFRSDCAIRFKLLTFGLVLLQGSMAAARVPVFSLTDGVKGEIPADTAQLEHALPLSDARRADLASLLAYSGIFNRDYPAEKRNGPFADPIPFSGERSSGKFNHMLAFDFRPGYVTPSHEFFRGINHTWKPIDTSLSFHLKYAFQFRPDTYIGRIYDSAYQGIGVGGYTFLEPEQLGTPFAFYLLQGARIARLHPHLSLHYEWNFGLSFGWKPYHEITNEYNRVIGSRVNAYINANFFLNWMVSRRVDLTAGVTMTHFSNGSTRLPNSGLNTIGGKVGVVYHFNRQETEIAKGAAMSHLFNRHMSYDLILFGSWKEKGILRQEGAMPTVMPTRGVFGFNFSPMYNLGYKFRIGASLDGVYDGSSNVEMEWSQDEVRDVFVFPDRMKQMSLGVSARAEYVMPYFTVSVGIGTNVIHGGGDLNTVYQVLALKIAMTRNSFLHIGYSLKQFEAPNFLMLGVGYRFNNKPQPYRP